MGVFDEWDRLHPQDTPAPFTPPVAEEEAPELSWFENFRRRAHLANQGQVEEAFSFDKDPAAIPEEADASWFGGIGRASKAGLNTLGGLQEILTTYPLRKAFGVKDSSDLRLSDFAQNNPILNPLGAARDVFSGGKENQALVDAIKLARSGDTAGAQKALAGRRAEGGVTGGVARAGAEFLADPTMPLSFGRKVGLAILPALVEGGVKAPLQWIQRAQKEGVTQELLSELPQTAVASVMAAMGVKGQRDAWSPKVAAATREAKAKQAAEASAEEQKLLAPVQMKQFPGLRSPESIAELQGLAERERPVDTGVLTPEIDYTLHETFSELLGMANEAVAARQDPMLRPLGVDAPLPKEVRFADEGALPDGTPIPPGAKAAVDANGVIWITPYGRAWTLQAPDAASVARRASELISHEVTHPSQEAGRPTGVVDPLTGMPVEGGANPETGHARGARVVDDRLGDLNMLQGEYALRRALASNPRLAGIAQYLDSTGRLNNLYGPEGLETATTGTYSPEVLSLAHELGLLGDKVEQPYGFLEAATEVGGPQITAEATAPHRLTPDLQGPQIFRKPGMPLGVATNKYAGGTKRPTAAQQLASVWTKPKDPRLQAALEADKARKLLAEMDARARVLKETLARENPEGPEARELAAAAAAEAAKMAPPPAGVLGGLKSKWMSLIRGVQPKPEAKPLLEDNSPEAAQARIALRQALGQSLRGQTKGNPVYTGEAAMARVQEWADNFRSGKWTEGNQAAMEGQGIPSGALREYWQGYYNMLTKHRAQHGADAPLSKELQRHKANLDVLRQRAPRASGTSPRQLGLSPRGQRGRVIAAASETTSKERSRVAQERGAESAEDVRKANREYQQERAFRERKLKQDRQTASLAQVRRVQQALNRAAADRVEPIKEKLREYLDAVEKEGLENLSTEQRRAYEDARRQAAAAEQMTPPPGKKEISDEEAAAIIAERNKPEPGFEENPSPERVAEMMGKAEATPTPPKKTATSFFGKLGKPKLSGGSKRKTAKEALGEAEAPVVEPVAPKNPAAARFFNRIKGLTTWAEKKAAKGAGNVFPQRPRTTKSGVKSMMATRKDATGVRAGRPLPPRPPAPPRTQAGPPGAPPQDWPFAGRLEEGKTPEPFDVEGLKAELAARPQDQPGDRHLPTKEAAVDEPLKQRTAGLKKFFSSLDKKRATKVSETFKAAMKFDTVHEATQFINDELGYGGKGTLSIDDVQEFAGALNAAGITDFKDAPPWAVNLADVGTGRASLRPGTAEDFTEKMSKTLTDLEMKRQKAGETKAALTGFYKIKNLPIGTGGRTSTLTKVTEAITTSESPAARRSALSQDEQAHRRLFGNEEETVNEIVTAKASGGIVGEKQRLTLDEIAAAKYSPATRARLETAFKRLLAQYRDGTLYSKPEVRYREDGTKYTVTLTPEERAVRALGAISKKLVRQGAVTAKKPGARLTANLGLKGGAATPFSGFRALQDLSSRLAKGVRLGALRALGIRAAAGTVPHPSATWKSQKYRRWKLTPEGKKASGEVEFQEPLKGKSQVMADVQEVLGIRFSPEQAENFWQKFNQGPAAAGGKRQLYSVLETVQAYREHLKNTRDLYKDIKQWFKNPDYKTGPKGEITTGVKRIDAALAQRRRYDRFVELTQDPKNKRAHKLLAYEVSLLVKKADPVFARKLVESPEKFSRQQLLGILPKGLSINQIMLTAEKVKPHNIQRALDNASAALNQAGVDIDAGYITELKYREVRNRLGTRSMEKDLVSVFTKLVQADGFEFPELQAAGGKVGRGSIPDSLNLLGKRRAFPTGGRKGGKAPTFDEETLVAAAVEKGVAKGAAAQEEAAATPTSRLDQLTEEEAAAAEKIKAVDEEKAEAPAVNVGELTKAEAKKQGMTGLQGLSKDLKELSTIKTAKVGMTKFQGARKEKRSKLRGLVEQTPGFYSARLPKPGAAPAQKEPGRMAAFDEEQAKSQPLEGYEMSPAAAELAAKVDGSKIPPGKLGEYVKKLVDSKKLSEEDAPAFVDKLRADRQRVEEAAAKGVRTSTTSKGSISYKPSISAVRKDAGAEPLSFKGLKKGRTISPPPGYRWSGASRRRRPYEPMPGVPKTLEVIANTPKSQLPKDTAASIKAQKTWATVGGWLNLPRPLLTAADVSGVFRQTWQLTSEQLVRDLSQLATGKVDDTSFLKNTWKMLKSFKDEDFYQAMKKELEADSWYKAGKEVGLRFVSDEHPNEAWVGKEKLNKALAKMKIFEPVSGIINASNRAFNYYQNKVMRDGFKHYIEGLEAYHELKKDSKGLTNDEIQDAVTHINNAASRGTVFKNPEYNERLNYVFYSAQMNVSRIRMLTNAGTLFAKYSTPASRHIARMQTLRAIAGAAAMTGVVWSIAKLQGEEPEIETSPISTDWGKVRFGNITFDGWGGNQQFLRAAAQAWTGKQKERSTGLPKDRKLGDVLVSFVRSKLGPGASTIWNIADERNLSGESTDISFDSADPVTGAWNLAKDLVMPMSVADTLDLWKENPRLAWLIPLMLMGEGMGAGGGAKERWLEDRSFADIVKGAPSARRAKDAQNSKEMRKFGVTPPRLGSKVTLPGRDKYGRKNYYNLSLSEKQEFESEYMPLVTDLLNEMINSDTYRKLPEEKKRKKLFRYVHRLNLKYGAARRARKTLRAKYRTGALQPSNRQPMEEDE